jgi:uncharacterized protein
LIVKLIILAIIVWLGLRIYKAYQHSLPRREEKRKIEAENMVACSTCGVHIPLNEALRQGNQYYCSKEHMPDMGSNPDG